MQKRRIQKIGGGSYSLVLPKDWVLRNKIAGEVEVAEHKGAALVIYPPNSSKRFIRTIEIGEKPRGELLGEIINLYSLGADEIVIKGALKRSARQTIREALRFTIGFEVMAETSEKIVLKSVLSPKELSFEQCLRSMYVNAASMIEDAVEAFLSRDTELAEDVIERDVAVDKLYHLVIRNHQSLLQDKFSEETLQCTLLESNAYEYLSTQIERIADHAVKIASLTLVPHSFRMTPQMPALFSKLSLDLRKIFAQAAGEKPPAKEKIMNLLAEVHGIQHRIDKAKAEVIRSAFTEGLVFLDSFERIRAYEENILEKRYQQTLFPAS